MSNCTHVDQWVVITNHETPIEVRAWASYQIRKVAGCACAGNAGNVFPRRRLQKKPLVSDPGMHVGIAYSRWCGKRSRHSRRMRTRNFTYMARDPWMSNYIAQETMDVLTHPCPNSFFMLVKGTLCNPMRKNGNERMVCLLEWWKCVPWTCYFRGFV